MLGTLAVLALWPGLQQTQMVDADEAIKKLNGGLYSSLAIEEKEREFTRTVDDFARNSSAMSRDEAADQWLALTEAIKTVPLRLGNASTIDVDEPVGSLTTVFEDLPRPDVWPVIEKRLAKRPHDPKAIVLQLLFARLRGDNDEVIRLNRLLSKMGTDEQGFFGQSGSILRDAFLRKGDVEAAKLGQPFENWNLVPNLVGLFGREKAKPILLHLLRSGESVNWNDWATREYARELALSNMDTIPKPDWSLFGDRGDLPAIRRLMKHYGSQSLVPGLEGGAATIYLEELLMEGKWQVVSKPFAANRPGDFPQREPATDFKATASEAAKIYSGLMEIHRKYPRQDLWGPLGSFAIASHQEKALIRQFEADRPKLALQLGASSLDNELIVNLYSALGDLRALEDELVRPRKSLSITKPLTTDYELFRIAGKIRDPQLDRKIVELPVFRSALSDPTSPFYTDDTEGNVCDSYIRLGLYGQAETCLTNLIRAEGSFNSDWALADLCRVYYLANRPKDILIFLNEYGHWRSPDLKNLILLSSGSRGIDRVDGDRLGFLAAWAFHQTGQSGLAKATLKALLSKVDYLDKAYELLNEIGGDDLPAFYDELAGRDASCPRPLMWNAALLLKTGQLDRAEKWARMAISLDPTDSQAPQGERKEGYEILARILKAKGDFVGANEASAVAQAARITQRGIDFLDVGLLPQAVHLFRQSIATSHTDFAAEEGLAECLQKLGNPAEALKHFINAYDLLSKSFGPATELNYTVGGMFSHSKQFVAAAPIFAKLDGKTASSAFVRAWAQEVNGEPREAIQGFKTAVSLDPTFFPAWKRLSELGSEGFLPPKEMEEVNLKLVGQAGNASDNTEFSPDLAEVSDLSGVYTSADNWHAMLTKWAVPLMSVPSSDAHAPYLKNDGYYGSRADLSPGQVLGQAEDIRAILAGFNYVFLN